MRNLRSLRIARDGGYSAIVGADNSHDGDQEQMQFSNHLLDITGAARTWFQIAPNHNQFRERDRAIHGFLGS